MNRFNPDTAAIQRLVLALTTGFLLALGARLSYTAEPVTPAVVITH